MRLANIYRLCLAVLLCGVALSSLRVILADNQPLWVDPTTNLVPSVMLRDLVLAQGEVTWARWLSSTTERLWLSSLLHLPFLLSIPEPLQAVRVAELCLHLGVIWGTYALGCQLAGRGVGLLAAYLLAAVPLMLSWGRAGNADPVIWATLLALFWVLLRLDLRRPRHALQLGLAAGLAASSRLIAMVYLGCAALWVLAFAVRNRRAAINLVPAALLSIILPGWWVAARWGAVSEAARRSTNRLSDPVLQVAQVYLMHGVGYVVLAGLIALAVAWRWGLLPGRLLSLFGFWLLLPVLQLLFMWDAWERYILPLMPMVALIVAVSALRLSERWPAARRRALVATLVLLGGLHLALVQAGVDWVSGLNLPDSRRYAALERVARSVPRVAPVLVMHSVFDDQFAFCLNLRQPPAARRSLYALPVKEGVWNLPAGARAEYVLRVQLDEQEAQTWERPPILGLTSFNPAALHMEDPFPGFKRDSGRSFRLETRHRDPNGVIFSLFRVTPPFTSSALP